ncbi:MAG: Gfo/Idh/MocA family oxidoreductase [Candidatus Omnitrophica bacterium]|nr:Gfo/Idh/MocA family oxidoreductase [Candidatus Omnitrophota bacterium]
MTEVTRRDFVKGAAVVGAGAAVGLGALKRSTASWAGANERVRVAVIGINGRGKSHLGGFTKQENVEVATICDVDERLFAPRIKDFFTSKGLKEPKTEFDLRRVMEDKDIHAVSIATPNHWHSLAAIWACQAGKDVYVEKPGSHNLFEGRQMVAAARKYKRIVQHGTQNRSSPHIMEGVRKLREGIVGDLYAARGLDYKIVRNMGRITPGVCPPGLDWDKWLGPKAMRPFSEFWLRNVHFCGLDLSSGGFANQAVHELDIIRWGMGLDRHPVQVTAVGRKFLHKDDDCTAPSHYTATFQFDKPDTYVTYEYRSWYTNGEAGFRDQYPFVQPDFPTGTIFLGTEGYLIFPDYVSYRTFFGVKAKPGPFREGPSEGCGVMANEPHMRNWVAACRARDSKLLTAEIEEGHKSMALCLLARTSYQVERPVKFDPDTETIVGDDEANALLNEPEYRAPYVVPKEV